MPLYEILCGSISSFIVSPIMTVIDSSIIKSQLQNIKFKNAFHETIHQYINKKETFYKPFGIMYMVYSTTYISANLIDLYCKKNNQDNKLPVLFGTGMINIAMISYKDKTYSNIFNIQHKIFPKRCYFLFGLRDLLTISSNFTFKEEVIQKMNKYIPNNLSDLIASLTLPICSQIISTPIHILAFDIYNHPNISSLQRWNTIKSNYKSVCFGRIIRVLPAFCLGGFINDMLRNRKMIL